MLFIFNFDWLNIFSKKFTRSFVKNYKENFNINLMKKSFMIYDSN